MVIGIASLDSPAYTPIGRPVKQAGEGSKLISRWSRASSSRGVRKVGKVRTSDARGASMITIEGVASFLLDRALVPPSWIIDGDLIIRSEARRNRNLRVDGPAGTGLFIKQWDDPASGGRQTLHREAAFIRYCRDEPAAAPVAGILPHLIAVDDERTVLIYELIEGAVSLQSQMGGKDSPSRDIETARAMGRALGTVHRIFGKIDRDNDPRLTFLPRAQPWVLKIHKPGPEMLSDIGPAHYEILRILQRPESFGERLELLGTRWKPGTVIHGDVRFDNVLVRPSRMLEGPNSLELRIADWEMVQIGDPAWDVASALQGFLFDWVSSMPLTDELSAEEMVARAPVHLDAVRKAARALWAGYREGSEIGPTEARSLLPRAVAFSAARLIQSAFEAAVGASRLPGRAVMLMQIGANLLAEPERGQVQLYGIPSA